MNKNSDPGKCAQLGAQNMLVNCANASSGERLLIAYESPSFGYYEADAISCVEAAAAALNLIVEKHDVGFSPNSPYLDDELKNKIEQADIVLFLARLGDQLRFSKMPKGKRTLVSYALDASQFGSTFGTIHHSAMLKLKNCIATVLDQAENVRVTCPIGTDFSGKPEMNLNADGDTSILRFPMSVFTPVPAHNFSGRVALCNFLTGTGSLYYDDYTVEFDQTLYAHFDKGLLTGFEGHLKDVVRANAHYDRVSEMFDIDRNFVHSWHAGIHPGCGYTRPAHENYERWSGSGFGNPRILHFHTCGAYAPGEISWNVVDPSITVDNEAIWENGRLHVDRITGGKEILEEYNCAKRAFDQPDRRIGLPGYDTVDKYCQEN